MKKILLSALLAVLLCIPWTQAQTSTITINDGTNTSGYVPVYGYNLDASNMHTQMLIPSDSLTTINGNAILSVMFYLQTAGDASKNFSNNWTITLTETTATSLSTSYEDVSSGFVVYTGLIDWKTTTPTITFASPYVYNGGNLLIDMHYTNSGGSWNSLNFYGVSSTGLSTMNYGSSDPTTATARSFSPKMTFGYGPAPTCYQPTGLTASNVTANSADFTWTASGHGETQYQYLCIPATDTVDWTNATLVSMTSDAVTGLTPNTSYKFYVRSYCSATDQSYVSSVAFRTACAAVDPVSLGTIGFETSEGFTGYSYGSSSTGSIGNCWTVGNIQSPTNNSYIPYVQVNSSYSSTPYSRTGDNCLKISAYKSTSSWNPTDADSAYAVMPEFTYTGGISTYEAHFYMRKSSSSTSYNDTLYVGVVSDPEDMSDLVIVDTLVNNTTTYAQQIVRFSNYTAATTGYIVFLATINHSASGSSFYGEFYIDDIQIVKGRATTTPVVDSVYNITTSTVQVAFSGSNATSYRIMAATQPVSDPDTYTTWAIDTVVTVSGATINVQSATKYYLYVQGFGSIDTSFISNPAYVFQSGCDVVATFPWTENFNSEANGEFDRPCWFNEHVDGPGTYPAQISTSGMGENTTPMLYFKDQTATTYTRVSTPEFNIPTAGAYEFNIDVYRSSSSAAKTLEGVQVIIENTTGYDTTFIPRVYSNTAGVGAEDEANVWYTYTFTLPKAGVQRVILLGCNEYGSSTYIDNLRIRKTPTCFKVDSVVLRDNQATQVTIGWNLTTASKYQVILTTEKINPDTLDSVPASAIAFNDSTASAVDSMTITGLTSATKYFAYVRGLCSDEIGEWSKGINFRTACSIYTISKTDIYSEGFESLDDASQDVPCWDILTTSTGTYPQVAANTQYRQYAHTGNNCWSFGTYAGTNDTTYMVMPETTNPINTLRLKFWVYGMNSVASANDSILVGYMTDATDRSTFTRLFGYQAPNNDGYELIDVDFGEYTAATGRIAVVRVPVGSASWYATAYYGSMLDDFTIELAPTCKKVKDVAATDITKNSADLSWTATTAANYEVLLADTSINPDILDSAALTHIIYNDTTITADSVVLNGLAQLTTYYAYVRGNCGAGDVSEWSDEYSFQTAIAMNYVDSFTVSMLGSTYVSNYGVDSLLAGSDNLIASTYSTWNVNTNLGSDSASIKWNVYGQDNNAYFATPLVDLRGATDANVSFDVCRRAYNSANEATSVTSTDATVFHVMVSTDGFQTIQNLLTFRNDSVEGDPVGDTSMYYGISTYYHNFSIDLSAYIGGNVQVLFGVSSHAYGHDYDLHLDNITIAGAYDTINVVATVNDTTMGTVTGSGIYFNGDMVTLTATAYEHFHFVNWSNGDTNPTMTFVATQDTIFTATFEADTFNLNVYTAGNGTVSFSGATPPYHYGDVVTLVATPDDGNEFTGWDNGEKDATITIVITSDTTITAIFSEIKTSVNDVEASDYVAYAEGQRIVVAGVEGHTVSLFDATGRLVATRTNANETETFDAPIAGVYMIKVNGMNTTAIVVK